MKYCNSREIILRQLVDTIIKHEIKDNVAFLDVGAGNCYYINRISSQFENRASVDFTIVDPSKVTKNEANLLINVYPQHRFNYYRKLDYVDYSIIKKIDYALFIHSLYYFDDWQSVLNMIFNAICTKSIVFIVLRCLKSSIVELKRRMIENIYHKKIYDTDLKKYLKTNKIYHENRLIVSNIAIPWHYVEKLKNSDNVNNRTGNLALQIGYFFLYRDYPKISKLDKDILYQFYETHKDGSIMNLKLKDRLFICYGLRKA